MSFLVRVVLGAYLQDSIYTVPCDLAYRARVRSPNS